MMTTRRIVALSALAACAVAASGCATAPARPGPHARPGAPKPAVLTSSQIAQLRGYGTGDTVFGLKVLGALCRPASAGNVVISPVSLETGLGMAFLGARDSTAAAMARVLALPAADRSLAAGLAARSALLASLNSPGVVFATSNRIWADPSLPIDRSFVSALGAAYQADLHHVPLLSRPQQARRAINAAVAAQTRGHITNLIPPGALSQIGWVLTDALYLNATWQHQFASARTQPGPFHASHGTVRVSYLNGGHFAVATADGWTAAKLPYRGGRLSMLALLPPAVPGPAATRCVLPGAGTLSALADRFGSKATRTPIALPKVNLASSESLQQVLTKLGMGVAFSGGANFTGLSPKACCLGFVQHAATLQVNEHGTVASAATGVGVQPLAEPLTLTFNRPYLLVIRDSLTGEPLMMAWVADPAGR
jgi:serpin B